MLDYQEKIHGEKINILFFDEFEDPTLKNEIEKKCFEHKISLHILKNLEAIDSKLNCDSYLITHFIIRIKSEFSLNFIKLLSKIKSNFNSHISASIAFSYHSSNDSLEYTNAIEDAKKQYGDCLNIMRPDFYFNTYWTVSNMKLIDNVICDTMRVKFSVNCHSTEIIWNKLTDLEKAFFLESSNLYHDYKMYHRSPSDGYFALKSKTGFYITCTKTIKNNEFNSQRIAEISNYDETNNCIDYIGKFLPSSDSVEAAILFKHIPNLHSIIHTHDSIRFTRNPKMMKLNMVEQLPYGEKELGYSLLEKSKENNSNLIIMREHGEIFLGRDHSAVEIVKEILRDFN